MSVNLLNRYVVDQLATIAAEAGQAIMQIYDQPDLWQVDMKSDASPLTQADLRANEIIVNALVKWWPEIPVLSEESPWHGGEAPTYWAVDPLDGTKEFIKRNGEFTVNIALVVDGVARVGVIFAPALKTLWAGIRIDMDHGSKALSGDARLGAAAGGLWAATAQCDSFDQCVTDNLNWIEINVAGKTAEVDVDVQSEIQGGRLRMLGSRSHGGDDLPEWLQNTVADSILIEKGSSLKFCLIAQGDADLYVRMGPTSIWDTAAGHAILAGAGGVVINLAQECELDYTDPRKVLNPSFMAYAPKRVRLPKT